MHELTHVLQDQHFDIGDRLEAVAEEDTDEESLRVLVEGDADRIEDIWVESLTDEEREALEAERAEESTTAEEALDELPGVARRVLREQLHPRRRLHGHPRGGRRHGRHRRGLRRRRPDPRSTWSTRSRSSKATRRATVEPPDVDGEPIEDLDGDFGAVSWYLMLAERTDPVAALAAVDGWGGDQFVAYRDGDRTCAALRFVGEDEAAATTMEAALDDWAAAMPAEADAHGHPEGDAVDVVTCDPGVGREGPGGRWPLAGDDLAARDPLRARGAGPRGGAARASRPAASRGGSSPTLDYEILMLERSPPPPQQAADPAGRRRARRQPAA